MHKALLFMMTCLTSRRSATMLALVIAVFLSGCTKTITTSYARPSYAVVEQAYIKEGADFSRYSKLTTDGLEIYYPDGSKPPQEEIERIRRIFRDAFLDAIGDDYRVVDEAGPDVLEVRAQLIDMVVPDGGDDDFTATGRLRDLVAHGELTFLMEIADSETGEVLGRAGDRTRDISTTRDAATWEEVERAARHWAGLFRSWLDRSLGRTG